MFHFDELDLALGRLYGLFEDRGELLARATPRRPEIDQHRLALRFLNDILDESLRRRVLDRRVRSCGSSLLQTLTSIYPIALPLAPASEIRSIRLIKWEQSRKCNQGDLGSGGGNRLDPRPMPGGFEEFKQIFAGNRGRSRIGQGVKIEHDAAIMAASSTMVTRPAVSLIAANGVTEPGSTPRSSRKSSAEPNENRPEAPSSRCSDFSSIAASSSPRQGTARLFCRAGTGSWYGRPESRRAVRGLPRR